MAAASLPRWLWLIVAIIFHGSDDAQPPEFILRHFVYFLYSKLAEVPHRPSILDWYVAPQLGTNATSHSPFSDGGNIVGIEVVSPHQLSILSLLSRFGL